MLLDADSYFASHSIQAADEGVTPTEELAAILLSKLALEPESHAQIARAGAIPVSRNGSSEGGLMKIVATRLRHKTSVHAGCSKSVPIQSQTLP